MNKRILIISIIIVVLLLIPLLCLNKDDDAITTTSKEETINKEVYVQEEIKPEISRDDSTNYVEKLDTKLIDNNSNYVESIKEEEIEINITKEDDTPSLANEYRDYCLLSKKEQYDYYKSFSSLDAFKDWYEKAKKEYELENPIILLEEGTTVELND